MKIKHADDYFNNDHGNPARVGYLWTETGVGNLRKIVSRRPDWWIITGAGLERASWCCHAGDTVYVLEPGDDHAAIELALIDTLERRRQVWSALAQCRNAWGDGHLPTYRDALARFERTPIKTA